MNTLRTVFVSLLLIGGIALLPGCFLEETICERGEGPEVEQFLQLQPFSGVELAISGTVYIEQGETQSVRIVGQQNIIDLIETDVNPSGIWVIKHRRCAASYRDLEVYITLPEVYDLHISGSGDIVVNGPVASETVDLSISGSGNIYADITADRIGANLRGSGSLDIAAQTDLIDSEISGSGDIKIAGTTRANNLTIRGSGSLLGFDLISSETDIRISGSGDARVMAETSLDVWISGSGDVLYKGSPAIQAEITGSGKIRRSN